MSAPQQPSPCPRTVSPIGLSALQAWQVQPDKDRRYPRHYLRRAVLDFGQDMGFWAGKHATRLPLSYPPGTLPSRPRHSTLRAAGRVGRFAIGSLRFRRLRPAHP